MALAFGAAAASAQDQCPGDFCDNPITTLCVAGAQVTLTGFVPAPPSDSGSATYIYEVCNPPAGTCDSTVRPGEGCLDNDFCKQQGQNIDPAAFCTRDCAVDTFRDLSHFDVALPDPEFSCLSEDTQISGTCNPGGVDQDLVIGDDPAPCGIFAAKCDAGLVPGQCYDVTLQIAGELNAPGLGAALIADKNAQACDRACIAGPSCEPCGDIRNGEQCLTRTRGFWSTHPHLIRSDDPRSLDLLPITVCGDDLTVVDHGVCSTSEALCTSARDRRPNPTYLSLAAQLTAAKLNLEATAAVSIGACSDFIHEGRTIEQWIAFCESGFCDARKQVISGSGCIEALNAFNNSQDVGFDQTPFPFDGPGPALVDECRLARGNGTWVGGGCIQP